MKNSNSENIAVNRTAVERFMDVGFTKFDPVATRPLLTDTYCQHNPMIPHGPEPLLQLLPVLKENAVKITNHRLIADENYVVTHNLSENVQNIVGHEAVVTFDIWRMDDGKLAEHWDNVQARANTNPSGRTQVDGVNIITDIDKTQLNKKLAIEFVNNVLIAENFDQAKNYVAADLIQHNTETGDGQESYIASLKNGWVKFEKLHMSVAEGNFVFTMLEGTRDGKPTAFHELFRLDDGKIVERWDISEEIPAEWPEDMQKF